MCRQIAVYILIADAVVGIGIGLMWMIYEFWISRNVKGWDD